MAMGKRIGELGGYIVTDAQLAAALSTLGGYENAERQAAETAHEAAHLGDPEGVENEQAWEDYYSGMVEAAKEILEALGLLPEEE